MRPRPPRTLGFAVWSDDLALAKELLEAGAAVDEYGPGDSGDFTPLMESFNEVAAFYDAERIELSKLLLAHGADASRRDAVGRVALHYAAGAGRSAVDLLLAHGADLGARDDDNETALHAAIRRCNAESAIALCSAGADPDAQNVAGLSPRDLVAEFPDVFTADELKALRSAFDVEAR